MFHCKSLMAGLLALALSPALQAADLVDAASPEALLQSFRGFGSAELDKTGNGDPQIIGRIDGNKFGVYFYGCENNRDCKDVQITAGWSGVSLPLDKINGWNRDKRFCKVYMDGEGDPLLEMDLNLRFGVTRANLDDTLEYWQICLRDFNSEMLGR